MKLLLVVDLILCFLTVTQCYQIVHVDLKTLENGFAHETDKYHMVHEGQLILRRGYAFRIKIRLKEPFKETDDIKTVATLTNDLYGMLVVSTLWNNSVVHRNGTTFDLLIFIPSYEAVGKWSVDVESTKPDPKPLKFQVIVYVIFNPWSPDDTVYFEKTENLSEYVLNDFGYVYIVNKYQKPWYYAQFLRNVFLAIMFLLDRFQVGLSERQDPVLFTRALSALVNFNDDNGIVMGRWDNQYAPYVHPETWLGSVEILEGYHRTNGYPVLYGQCWVYAAVLTTICRALGIPSRPVTNYNSAHDRDLNLAMDVIYWFNPITGRRETVYQDLIWNYHVWTEVWMERKDLPPGYGGWQVIDGTPQENKSGGYRTGPASVKAVKEGALDQKYELPFIYSEVNADQVTWQTSQQTYNKKVTNVTTTWTGSHVITKPIQRNELGYEDLTSTYKYREGSPQERYFFNQALKRLGYEVNYVQMIYGRELVNTLNVKSQLCKESLKKDVCEQPFFGDNVVLTLTFDSEQTPLTVIVSIKIEASDYTGYYTDVVKEDPNVLIDLKPNQTQEYKVHLDEQRYTLKLAELQMLQIVVVSQSTSIHVGWVNKGNVVHFRKPTMVMKVPGKIKNKEKFRLSIHFKNPMRRTLTNCQIRFTGQGLHKIYLSEIKNIDPFEDRELKFNITPRGKGPRTLIGMLRCAIIKNIYGEVHYNVE